MAAITESDLKRLEDLIVNGQRAIEDRLTKIETGQEDLKVKIEGMDKRLVAIETRLDEWKPSIAKTVDLAEKVGELKNWKQIGLITITAALSSLLSGTIGGVIGWLLRSTRFVP